MDIKKLREICGIVSGGTPLRTNAEFWDGGIIPWIKIGDIKGKYVSDADEHITRAGLEGSSAKMLSKGTILYTIFATLGEVGILTIDACTNQAIAGITIRNKDEVLTDYLYYYLKSKKSYVNNLGRGVAQNNINLSILRDLEVPLPTLSVQRQTVDILDKTAKVIKYRLQQLQKLDDLVKARFVELFGELDKNPYGWKLSSLGALIASCEAGWSGTGTQRKKRDGEVAVLKVSAVTKGYFIPSECKVLDNQSNIKKYIYPQTGDLLFSRANTREMVGATVVITEDFPEHILPDKLWKIRFVEAANVWYMKYALSSKPIRSIFSSISTGTSGSMYNVSMEKFKSIEIPLPPLNLQNQFAVFVTQTDKSKAVIQKALAEAQLLFDSLMQKYFG